MTAEYRLGNGTIRRSKTGKGSPYWGRLRINPHQLAALVAWTAQNTAASYHDELYWELDIACWLRDGQEGDRFFSFAVEMPFKSTRVEVGSVPPLGPGRPPGPAPDPAPPTPVPTPTAAALDLDQTPF